MGGNDLFENGIDFKDVDAAPIRKIIAKRMVESKSSVPHFYLTVDVDMENASQLRMELNEGGDKKISFNDILIKAIAVALKDHPECNVSYIDDKIRYYDHINISLAVTIDGGLLTPTVTDCDKKAIDAISEESKILIDKARKKRLRPKEGMGGTFSLSNLGMFGIEEFSAIINPPQALILAVGAIREVPVVKNGEIKVGKMMKMTLSCDHRAVDGAMAAVFLSELKSIIENSH